MDEEMTNVRKYTGQTADEVERMNEDFKKMDTRTAREKLNQLAGDAGRLGITATSLVEEFVDGADKINVALGDDLGDEAVSQIGKLALMFWSSTDASPIICACVNPACLPTPATRAVKSTR